MSDADIHSMEPRGPEIHPHFEEIPKPNPVTVTENIPAIDAGASVWAILSLWCKERMISSILSAKAGDVVLGASQALSWAPYVIGAVIGGGVIGVLWWIIK